MVVLGIGDAKDWLAKAGLIYNSYEIRGKKVYIPRASPASTEREPKILAIFRFFILLDFLYICFFILLCFDFH